MLDDLLNEYSAEVRELAEMLRELVKKTVPEASEKVYPVWRGIGFTHPEVGYFCAIFLNDKYVKLGFEFGVLLPDEDKILMGNGRQVRYLVVKTSRDIKPRTIKKFIDAALALPASKQEKLDLIHLSAKSVNW